MNTRTLGGLLVGILLISAGSARAQLTPADWTDIFMGPGGLAVQYGIPGAIAAPMGAPTGGTAKATAPKGSYAVNVTSATYAKEVASSALPVLVLYCSPADAYCRAAAAAMDALAGEFAGKAKFAKVNVDKEAKLKADAGITEIPTYQIIKGGKLSLSMGGKYPKLAKDIKDWLRVVVKGLVLK